MRGDNWLIIAGIILIISIPLHQVQLALIALLFLLTGGISRLWNRYCLNRLEYKRRLSSTAFSLARKSLTKSR